VEEDGNHDDDRCIFSHTSPPIILPLIIVVISMSAWEGGRRWGTNIQKKVRTMYMPRSLSLYTLIDPSRSIYIYVQAYICIPLLMDRLTKKEDAD